MGAARGTSAETHFRAGSLSRKSAAFQQFSESGGIPRHVRAVDVRRVRKHERRKLGHVAEIDHYRGRDAGVRIPIAVAREVCFVECEALLGLGLAEKYDATPATLDALDPFRNDGKIGQPFIWRGWECFRGSIPRDQ